MLKITCEDFSGMEKDHTKFLKSKKTMQLVQIYCKNCNKMQIITNYLAFFSFFLTFFSSLIRIRILNADPGPEGKLM